jgi:glutaconate CoA-transferase subunit B
VRDRVVPAHTYTSHEMMTVAAARMLSDVRTCFVGIGVPSAAANLARLVHAPHIVLIYESGAIGAKPDRLPLSIGDGILADCADAVVPISEIFNYWLQSGRIDLGFLTAAQIDRLGNLNTTVIGPDYRHPTVRLPGAGGAPEIASLCHELIIVLHHTRRAFVERLDFVTSVGFGNAPGDRARLGLKGNGPRAIVTDLGILQPDPDSCELTLVRLFPGSSVREAQEATSWPLRASPHIDIEPPPSAQELAVLRKLEASLPQSPPPADGTGAPTRAPLRTA